MTARKLRELADKLDRATMENFREVCEEVEMELRRMLANRPMSKD